MATILAVLLTAAALLGVAAAPASAATASDLRSMLLGWVNEDRAANGLVAWRAWGALDDLTANRAGRMADTRTLSHAAAGGNVGEALDRAGIPWSWYGETLGMSPAAWGAASARQVFDAWLGSPAHRDILRSDVDNYVGIGVARGGDGSTWISLVATQSPDHTRPVVSDVTVARSGTTVTVTWRATDPRLQSLTAGLRSYDVLVRRDAKAWWVGANDTTATSLVLANRPHGSWFSFRVQAADRRGTLSTWSTTVRIWMP